jgi:hypothetical protein
VDDWNDLTRRGRGKSRRSLFVETVVEGRRRENRSAYCCIWSAIYRPLAISMTFVLGVAITTLAFVVFIFTKVSTEKRVGPEERS